MTSSTRSRPSTALGVDTTAPNFWAWMSPRLVSSSPLMPSGKPEVVLNAWAGGGLTADGSGLEQQGEQPIRGAVDPGSETRRTRTDDHEVECPACIAVRESEVLR